MMRKLYLLVRSFVRHHILHIDDRSQLEIAIANGLKIGSDCCIMGGTILDPGFPHLIEIGDRVTIASRCYILAHDASCKKGTGYTVIGKVKIGNEVFIGADSLVLPGVSIGDNCVIGAGSVVSHSIPSNSVAVGNPAKIIGTYEDYISRRKQQMKEWPVYDDSFLLQHITAEQKKQMQQELESTKGFIV